MKKLFRNMLKCTSLSTALFIFQACYGMPQGMDDFDLELEVVDGNTLKPIQNASVMTKESGSTRWVTAGKTDLQGRFLIFSGICSSADLRFEAEHYQPKDTTITDIINRTVTIKMYGEQ